MAKKELQDNGLDKQKNKSHKTLREKLRKKRVQEKEHLKQKKEKRKLFNPEEQKRTFFIKHFNSLTQASYKDAKKSFKYKKIKKYIEKFINIYQDDLQDFFALFKQFDEGGFIDISGLENKKLQKVLLKLFKYLPLNIEKKDGDDGEIVEYRKKKQSKLNLENVIRNLVTESIENYLENGTQDEKSDKSEDDNEESSENENIAGLKKNKKNKKDVTVNIRNEDEGVFTLPQPKIQPVANPSFGPSISAQERQKIAQLFSKQLKDMENQKQEQKSLEDDKFEQIFSMGQAVNKLKNPIARAPKKSALEDIPEHLLAEGSARIGQKITINDDDQMEYDTANRPKKLIDEHRQIMAINRGQDPSQSNSSYRKPFDRERDVVNSRNKMSIQNMKNGLFFNFSDKMTAPKKTNNFL